MGGIVSAALPVVGAVAGGLFGGSSAPSAPNVNVYQPGGTATADQNLQNLLTQSYNNVYGSANPYTTLNPQIVQAFQQLFNPSNAAGYQTAANAAGGAYNTIGNQGVGAGGAVSNAALGLLPGATSVMNLGLDPQSALYSQMLQKATDTANVTNAMYGLTGQQAAGNTAQDINNFNMNWQNNQLERAISGLNAGGTAVDRAGTGTTAGQNVGSAGAGSILAGGSTPYAAGQTIGQGNEAALMQYLAQLFGPSTSLQPTISNLGGYLNTGINASTAGADQALRDYYAQLNGSQLGSIGGYFGGQSLSNMFTPTATTAAPAAASSASAPWLTDILDSSAFA